MSNMTQNISEPNQNKNKVKPVPKTFLRRHPPQLEDSLSVRDLKLNPNNFIPEILIYQLIKTQRPPRFLFKLEEPFVKYHQNIAKESRVTSSVLAAKICCSEETSQYFNLVHHDRRLIYNTFNTFSMCVIDRVGLRSITNLVLVTMLSNATIALADIKSS